MKHERRGLSLLLTALVHGGIVLALVVSVRWQTKPITVEEVELWSSPPAASLPIARAQDPTPRKPAPPVSEPKTQPRAMETPPVRPDIAEPAPPKPKPAKLKPEPPKPEPPKPTDAKPTPPKPVDPKPKSAPEQPIPPKKNTLSELAAKALQTEATASSSAALAALDAKNRPSSATSKPGAMDAYLVQVRNKIRQHMTYPDDGRANLSTLLEVTLIPDMTILEATIVRSSGQTSFDQAALRALLRAGQYPALTAGVAFEPLRKHRLEYRLREGSE